MKIALQAYAETLLPLFVSGRKGTTGPFDKKRKKMMFKDKVNI
jgi:hypothetical protein